MRKVRHKLSGEVMTVIRVNGAVTVCKLKKPIKLEGWSNLEVDKAICLTENLERL